MKKTIGKIFDFISTITSFLMMTTLIYFNALVNDTTFNGITILIGICMLINPVLNLYRLNKKRIYNPIYHLIVISFTSIVSYISIIDIFKYYNDYNINHGNAAGLEFTNKLLYMLIGAIMIDLISFLFKKELIKIEKDNSKIIFLIIALTSLSPFLNETFSLATAVSLVVFIFSIIMVFKLNSLNASSDLRKLYAVLVLLNLFTSNIVGVILLICMYIQLDKFGLNI